MKESFLVSERRASKQLLKMVMNNTHTHCMYRLLLYYFQGTTLLSLLESITEVESISRHFITPPLAVRTASAVSYCIIIDNVVRA